jgi:WD repeat-containing protein 23
MTTGTCTIHSWNDGARDDWSDPDTGIRVNEQLKHDADLYENSRLRNARTSLFRTRLRSERLAARENDIDEGPF